MADYKTAIDSVTSRRAAEVALEFRHNVILGPASGTPSRSRAARRSRRRADSTSGPRATSTMLDKSLEGIPADATRGNPHAVTFLRGDFEVGAGGAPDRRIGGITSGTAPEITMFDRGMTGSAMGRGRRTPNVRQPAHVHTPRHRARPRRAAAAHERREGAVVHDDHALGDVSTGVPRQRGARSPDAEGARAAAPGDRPQRRRGRPLHRLRPAATRLAVPRPAAGAREPHVLQVLRLAALGGQPAELPDGHRVRLLLRQSGRVRRGALRVRDHPPGVARVEAEPAPDQIVQGGQCSACRSIRRRCSSR